MDAGGFVGELCRMTRAGELDWSARNRLDGATYEAVNGRGRSVFVQRGLVFIEDGDRTFPFSADTRELEAVIGARLVEWMHGR